MSEAPVKKVWKPKSVLAQQQQQQQQQQQNQQSAGGSKVSTPPPAIGSVSPTRAARDSKTTSPAPPSSPPAEAKAQEAPPPPPPPEKPVDWVSDYYPEDCIYEPERFVALAHCKAPVSEMTLKVAQSLWRSMPENASLTSAFVRENLFRNENAAALSKVKNERKIHNEVMGVMCRITELNKEVMKDELTALPIRQSTKEEIQMVIKVFFLKATRPEDSCFAPLYVELLRHLIHTYGEHEDAGQNIRLSIVKMCQETFMGMSQRNQELEAAIANLPPAEQDAERMANSGHQRCNMQFLGLLFVNHLVRELLIRAVLDDLLYGGKRARNSPSSVCIVLFMELLQTCGPYLGPEFGSTLARYRDDLTRLSETHPEIRIRCLLLDFLETMQNNWVPLHGKNAKRVGNAPVEIKMPLMTEMKRRVPEFDEFRLKVDDFFSSSALDELVALAADIPEATQRSYCQKCMYRYLTTARCHGERQRLGELFEELDRKGSIKKDVVRDAMSDCMEQAINEKIYEDMRDFFSWWTVVVRNGKEVFPFKLHTDLIDRLVDAHADAQAILRLVCEVNRAVAETVSGGGGGGATVASSSSPSGGGGNNNNSNGLRPAERFRVLQALLRYRPRLGKYVALDSDIVQLAGAGDEEAELSDDGANTKKGKNANNSSGGNNNANNNGKKKGGLGAESLLSGADVECRFYYDLLISNTTPLSSVTSTLKASNANVFPLVSALFTYVAYDTSVLEQHREILKRLFLTKAPEVLMEEVYHQHMALGLHESTVFAFVRDAQTILGRSDIPDKMKKEKYMSPFFATSMDTFFKQGN